MLQLQSSQLQVTDASHELDLRNIKIRAHLKFVSSGGAPTPAGTTVFTKHNWDMGMGNLGLNGWGYHLNYGWGIYGLLGWAFDLMGGAIT